MAERVAAQRSETDGQPARSRVDAPPTRPNPENRAGSLAGVLARQPNAGNRAVGRLARALADRPDGGGRTRRLSRRVSDSHPNAKALNTAQDVLAEGKVWTEQHYSDALLTDAKLSNRAATLAYGRALQNIDIEMSRKQQARQEFAPVLNDLTESRIGFRRDALWEIGQKKSVKQGLSAAEAKTDDPEALEQIRLVAADMKLIQDDFRDRAYDNAYKMLDDSAREVGAMLSSYGVLIASAWDVVRFVRVYEGELEKEASDWLETARLANTSGYSDPKKAKHRKDLGATLQHLRQLQHSVKLAKRAHPNPGELITGPLAPMIAPASPVIAKITPKVPDHPEVKQAKAELVAAWINAEREQPVLAGYRGDEEDLEDVSLGSLGSSEKDDMQAVVESGMRILANILTAKLALRQKKVSPYELGPVVALTRAQMLIRRGSVWDIAVEDKMRGDDDGADWAKAAMKVALSALMLFPGTWLLALASVGLNLYSAGQEYVRYGLDKALAGTSLDRAKALSSKTPSLAGFAWALVGAGLDAVGARAAFGEAEALSAKVLAGDEEAVAALNKLGETRGVKQLGDEVAKTRPVASHSTGVPPRSARVPTTEEEAAGSAAGGRGRISPTDRGKGSRPFYAKDPKRPKAGGRGGSGGGRTRPIVTAPTGGAATPRLAEFRRRIENFERPVTSTEIHGAPEGPGGSPAGHARSKHGWTDEMVADLVNKPARRFSGWNTSKPAREVDIYWRDGDVAITEAGDKTSVITAYGKSSPRDASYVDPKWADDARYVEVTSREVSYPSRERWEADDWPWAPSASGPTPPPTAPAPPAGPPAGGPPPAPTPATK